MSNNAKIETVMRIELNLDSSMECSSELSSMLARLAKEVRVKGWLPENRSIFDTNGKRIGAFVVGEYVRNPMTRKFEFIERSS